jgi:hypothetical protein
VPAGAGEPAISRLDRFRNADGGTSTAELRLNTEQRPSNTTWWLGL